MLWRRGVKVSEAVEKSRSLSTEVPGAHKYFSARIERVGNAATVLSSVQYAVTSKPPSAGIVRYRSISWKLKSLLLSDY